MTDPVQTIEQMITVLEQLEGECAEMYEQERVEVDRQRSQALTTAIAALRRSPLPQWQPIESAPKDGRTVIGYDPLEPPPNSQVDGTYWHAEVACWIWADDGCEAKPTHWIPLPEAPTPQGPREETR